ncbi:hypothetical protein [Pontimicrobium sp. MEBiC06410]
MKNLLSAFLMLAFVTVVFTSCTAEDLNDEQNTELATGQEDSTSPNSDPGESEYDNDEE